MSADFLRKLQFIDVIALLRDCTYLLQLSFGGGGNTFRRCTK